MKGGPTFSGGGYGLVIKGGTIAKIAVFMKVSSKINTHYSTVTWQEALCPL
ncbi:hypothetical protein [Bartonella vinsonii]|uniref:hypothetical protein n=1 Tax=Bartonella vinsonii TaxID=33047 RepID=UPI0013DF756D|nr:hypothetical protein [Bartonella vinsonii]